MCVHLNGQLVGEVAPCKAGQVSTEEEEEEAKGHGLLHLSIAIGFIDLPTSHKHMCILHNGIFISGWKTSRWLLLTVKWTAGNTAWIWALSPRCSTPTRCPHTPPAGRGSTVSRWRTAAPERSSWRRPRPQSSRESAPWPWGQSRLSWEICSPAGTAASKCNRLFVLATKPKLERQG